MEQAFELPYIPRNERDQTTSGVKKQLAQVYPEKCVFLVYLFICFQEQRQYNQL